MKRSEDKNWQLASAYIDNELSLKERAAFEARLLQEPRLAETLDEVQYVSMTLSRLHGERKKVALASPALGMRKYLIAGALAASLTATMIYSAVIPHFQTVDPVKLHQEFVSQEMTLQSMSDLQHVAYSSGLFPDLSAGNFTLMGEKETDYGIAAHYAGRRNCRLTLIIGQDIPPITDQETQSTGWTSENHEYLLMSHGMDPERFQLIGDYLRKTQTDKPPISRLALREEIRKTKNCG